MRRIGQGPFAHGQSTATEDLESKQHMDRIPSTTWARVTTTLGRQTLVASTKCRE